MTLSVARFAEREGLIALVPFKASPSRPHKPKERKPFPLSKFGDYYMAMEEFAQPLFLALAASGNRVSAICRIDVSDLRMSEGWVEVTKKGGKRRRIPLSKPLRRAIIMALDLGQKVNIQSTGAVFVNRFGRRWNTFSFRLAVIAACEKAGLPFHTPHTLRTCWRKVSRKRTPTGIPYPPPSDMTTRPRRTYTSRRGSNCLRRNVG